MKLIFLISLALAGDPVVAEEAPPEPVARENAVAQAEQMNAQLSEILARVEELKTDDLVGSEPAKRVEPPPPSK